MPKPAAGCARTPRRNPILPGAAGLILTGNYLFKLGARVNGTRLCCKFWCAAKRISSERVPASFTRLITPHTHTSYKHTSPLQIADGRSFTVGFLRSDACLPLAESDLSKLYKSTFSLIQRKHHVLELFWSGRISKLKLILGWKSGLAAICDFL